MTNSKLIRWSGVAAMAGGALLIAGFLGTLAVGQGFERAATATGLWVSVWTLNLAGYVLVLLGLIGLYAVQAERAGILGLVGFALVFVGQVLDAGLTYLAAFAFPVIAAYAPAAISSGASGVPSPIREAYLWTVVLWAAGYIVFGIASYRARVLPRWASALLAVGGVTFFLPPVFALALIGLGFSLRSVGAPAPASAPLERR